MDLTEIDPDLRIKLFTGKTVCLSQLYRKGTITVTDNLPERLHDGLRRARTIYRKARINFDERGINTLYWP